jgi:hypothetical protein
MIVIVNNKSVLFRLSMCTVTLTRSSGRPDRNTSTKYLRRSRRAYIKNINWHTILLKLVLVSGCVVSLNFYGVFHNSPDDISMNEKYVEATIKSAALALAKAMWLRNKWMSYYICIFCQTRLWVNDFGLIFVIVGMNMYSIWQVI